MSGQVHLFVNGEAREAKRWFDAIMRRTRDNDVAYLTELQKATLCCMRRGLHPEVSAQVAQALPLCVRGLWFERWVPAEPLATYADVDAFIDCVRPFVRSYGADAVIEEDVIAVAQTFFKQWPQVAEIARPFFPSDLFEHPGQAESASGRY